MGRIIALMSLTKCFKSIGCTKKVRDVVRMYTWVVHSCPSGMHAYADVRNS